MNVVGENDEFEVDVALAQQLDEVLAILWPGATTKPLASMVLLALKSAGGWPMPTILPAAMKTSCCASMLLAGSINLPFLMCSFMRLFHSCLRLLIQFFDSAF